LEVVKSPHHNRRSRQRYRKAVIENRQGVEKEVVILLTDMEGYSWRASEMTPVEIQTFMVDYHLALKDIVRRTSGPSQSIEPSAGDGAVAVFEFGRNDKKVVCTTALRCALEILAEIGRGTLPRTRIGLFSGRIIETRLDQKTMRFGSSFAVVSRLERLCAYFGIYLLFGREVARRQTDYHDYLVSIGKITPRNFTHPIHIFSLYRPGIHHCPLDIDAQGLREFIARKNRGVEFFCGNIQARISPDFPKARQLLAEAQDLFVQLTGTKDPATERLLEYIVLNPCPDQDFSRVGMRIRDRGLDATTVHIPGLSGKLLKSADNGLYRTLVEETAWETKFKLIWCRANEHVFRERDEPNGIYFIDRGSVDILTEKVGLINSLGDGDIFGEMAYFTAGGKRTATVMAKSDLVLRRVSWHDLEGIPVIKELFQKIADKRRPYVR
jgi:class 3 adenylate cyclase